SQQFSLTVRQQPIQGRLCTNNEKDRKSIEPPPIIQIQLNNATEEETQNFLQNPYYFMCVNLVHPLTYKDIIQDHPVLSGQTVSSMYKLKDITNSDGSFFCFGDLSSKIEGEFKLKFTLCEILTTSTINLMHIYSQSFHVYHPKKMPKPVDTTFLSRSFSDQGVRIRIRKEHRIQT
ncbi:velvet factor, partial [Cunninghamella echinulata]